jgi:hypothetical protein
MNRSGDYSTSCAKKTRTDTRCSVNKLIALLDGDRYCITCDVS